MSNVLSFSPPPIVRNPKGLKDYVKTINIPSLIKDIVGGISTSDFLKEYPDQYADLNRCKFISDPDDVCDVFVVESRIREVLIPHFGIQNHLDYITLQYGYSPEHMDLEVLPEDITLQMCSYFKSFSKDINTTNLLMCYAILQSLTNQQDLRYVDSGRSQDSFVLQMALPEPSPQGWFLITLTINFLTLLLDDAAMRFMDDHQVNTDTLNDNDFKDLS